MASAAEAVLDASAVLALLNEEPGSEVVEPVLDRAAISAVNLSEVVGKLVDHGLAMSRVRDALAGLELAVHPLDAEAAYQAAALRRIVPATLSLGDRACLVLAHRLGVPAMTADSAWSSVRMAGLTVRLIR